MNRTERLSAILIQLQSHSQVKAKQISERFDISLRTVYRDIRALEEAGIPIIGNPGVGYSLVEGYKLSPLMFTQEEALSFLIAEKLIYELADTESNRHFRSGIEKIRAVMRMADKKILEIMDDNVAVLNTYKSSSYYPDILLSVLQSIYQKRILSISYLAGNTHRASERKVEPAGIFFSGLNWYMMAYCLRKDSTLIFRIDRIKEITILDELQSHEQSSFKKTMNEFYDKEQLCEVVIRVNMNASSQINDEKYYYGLISEKEEDGMTELRFLTFSISKFAHWYLSFADNAMVVTPESLKDEVRQIIGRIVL